MASAYPRVAGNAWNNQATGKGGLSPVISVEPFPFITIMGILDSDSEIAVFVSQDGTNFYYDKVASDLIVLLLAGEGENLAVTTGSISASADTGDASNMITGEAGNWETASGGDMSDDPLWVLYDMGEDQEISNYSLEIDSAGSAPKAFKLYGWSGIYELDISDAESGTFKLGDGDTIETAALDHDASAATIQAALRDNGAYDDAGITVEAIVDEEEDPIPGLFIITFPSTVKDSKLQISENLLLDAESGGAGIQFTGYFDRWLLDIGNPTGGTFHLGDGADIDEDFAHDANASTVQAALRTAFDDAGIHVTKTGEVFTIETDDDDIIGDFIFFEDADDPLTYGTDEEGPTFGHVIGYIYQLDLDTPADGTFEFTDGGDVDSGPYDHDVAHGTLQTGLRTDFDDATVAVSSANDIFTIRIAGVPKLEVSEDELLYVSDNVAVTGDDWILLDTRVDVTFEDDEEKLFTVHEPGDYQYYKLEILESYNDSATRISCLKLYQVGEDEPAMAKTFVGNIETGAHYIRLKSKDDVLATVTVAGKP